MQVRFPEAERLVELALLPAAVDCSSPLRWVNGSYPFNLRMLNLRFTGWKDY